MQPVTHVSGTAYPWGQKNVDTDVIIPAHWLKTVTREGLGKGAFETVTADLKAMAAIKNPTELFKLQGEIARRNFDAAVARASINVDCVTI